MARIRTTGKARRIRGGILAGREAGLNYGKGVMANPFYGFNFLNATIDQPANRGYFSGYGKALSVLADSCTSKEWENLTEANTVLHMSATELEAYYLSKRVAELETQVRVLSEV